MQNKKRLILIIGGALLAVIAIAVIVFFVASNEESFEESYRIIKLEDYSGSVEVQRKNNLIELFNGLQLVSGDSSAIGDDSLMLLLIDSDKHMMVSENTKFNVKATGTEEKGKVVIDITDGRASFAIDNKLGEDSVFEVHTPNATTSIRGTVFSVSYDPSNDRTSVAVDEGVVEVKSVSGERSEVSEGETICIAGNEVEECVPCYIALGSNIDDKGVYADYYGETFNSSVRQLNLTEDVTNLLFFDVLSKHADEHDEIIKETSGARFDTFNTTGKNVTHWFPEEVEMDIGDGVKKYVIDSVRLSEGYYVDKEGVTHTDIVGSYFLYKMHEADVK